MVTDCVTVTRPYAPESSTITSPSVVSQAASKDLQGSAIEQGFRRCPSLRRRSAAPRHGQDRD
jgi:hypothetical protein